jgi:hypothetical protein
MRLTNWNINGLRGAFGNGFFDLVNSPETVEFIRTIAKENGSWGAEWIRGELLELGIRVCKRTIQKYLPKERGLLYMSQTWAIWREESCQRYLGLWFHRKQPDANSQGRMMAKPYLGGLNHKNPEITSG